MDCHDQRLNIVTNGWKVKLSGEAWSLSPRVEAGEARVVVEKQSILVGVGGLMTIAKDK